MKRRIPFKELNDLDEFYQGATFIEVGTGLKSVEAENDHYEYVLFNDMGNRDYMLCAHIDDYYLGNVVAHVNKTKGANRHTVTAKEFRRSMILSEKIDSWFFVEDGVRNKRIAFEE